MSTAQRLAAVLGVVLAVLGLTSLVAPGVIGTLPTDRGMVLVLGILLVLGGFRELQRRRVTDREYAETPDTEAVVELPTPGDEFDDHLDRLTRTRYRVTERKRIRDEVGDVTEATLVRRQGISPEEAREAMRAGTWTDDPFAASMFSNSPPAVGPLERVREYLSPRSPFHHRTQRAVAELARLVDDPQDPTPATGHRAGSAAGSDSGPDPDPNVSADSKSDADPASAAGAPSGGGEDGDE